MSETVAVAGALSGAKNVLLEWGVPIAGLAGGIFLGAPLRDGVYNLIFRRAGVEEALAPHLGNNTPMISWLITSAIFAGIGVAVHKYFHGWMGKSIAFAMYGVAIGGVLRAFTGTVQGPYYDGKKGVA